MLYTKKNFIMQIKKLILNTDKSDEKKSKQRDMLKRAPVGEKGYGRLC